MRGEDSSRLLEISGPLKKVKDGTRGLSSRTHRHSGESSSSRAARSLPEVPIEVALFSQITAIQMHILEPEEITRYFCPRTVVCAAHLDWSRRAFERRESRILYRQESAYHSERASEQLRADLVHVRCSSRIKSVYHGFCWCIFIFPAQWDSQCSTKA